jgi:hypothetical protein
MTFKIDRWQGALAVVLLLGASCATAFAEEPPSVWPKDIYSADENAAPAGETPENEAEGAPAQTVDLNNPDIDWSQLDTTSAAAGSDKALKARRALQDGAASSWSAQDKSNGASALSVKQPVIPFWDTRVGADLTVARQQPSSVSEALQQKFTTGEQQSSGAAWAAMTAPGVGSIWDKTAIEARVDPSQEQSRFGTSLSKSVPLGGEQTSLTLQNGTNVTQQGLAPIPGITGRAARNYALDQSAKLSIADTGTSFIAGQTLSSADDKWLRKIGAEQQLFGGVSVSGSIGETPQGAPNKSISAGFKRSW